MGSDDLLVLGDNSGKKRSVKLYKNKEKRGSSSRETSQQSVRMQRELHTVQLNPPDFTLPSSRMLIDDYIEKEVQYVASIPNVPFSIDPTRRTDILKVLDNARQHNFVTDWSGNQDAIFSFSAKEIKLLKRDPEAVILREVVHNIAAVSYIQDSGRHLVFVKTAIGGSQEPEHCRLIVCACASKDRAEELCSIIQQIFDVVYTELTIASFEESLKDLYSQSVAGSSQRSYAISHRRSSENLTQDPCTHEDCRCREANPLIVLLKEYIETIKRRLSEEELRQFGQILQVYKANQDLKKFCFDLYRLYGKEREDLIPGIRPYIPERDIAQFDSFLTERGIQTSFWPDPKRTPSETSSSTLGPDPYSFSEIDDAQEHDRHLLGHMHTVEQLEKNIDT